MSNARITNSKANVAIRSVQPNAQVTNGLPNALIKSTLPYVRVSNFQTGRKETGATISAGMPIGLLLALTYGAASQNPDIYFGDHRPNVRIRTT